MEKNHVQGFEQVIIDYAKAENLTPSQAMSSCQTALLNVAGWICACYGYSNDEYEAFMKQYADEVNKAVERSFRKE